MPSFQLKVCRKTAYQRKLSLSCFFNFSRSFGSYGSFLSNSSLLDLGGGHVTKNTFGDAKHTLKLKREAGFALIYDYRQRFMGIYR